MARSDDWIKLRTNLKDDSRVLRMIWSMSDPDSAFHKEVVGSDEDPLPDSLLRVTIIGALSLIWGTVRHQGVALPGGDCLLEGANSFAVDTVTGIAGFGEEMVKVGWCHDEDEGLVFPEFFSDFNTIPKRTPQTDAEKQKAYRERQKAMRGALPKPLLSTYLEKEKEIKKEETTSLPKKVTPQRKKIPPKLEWVAAFCAERENGIDAQEFIDHYEASGWVRGKSKTKIVDWQAAIRTWEKNRGNGSRQTTGAGGGSGKTSAREHNQQVGDYLDSVIAEERGKGAI
jgi:hypothetical protein